ncbi:MAG: hypothetical protein HC815_30850 [Richelia sp. RM1_1_1]|nr:hypothetical protein [Richelia sp. RM1_1_1]
MTQKEKSNRANPRFSVTVSEGHYRKLTEYADSYNLGTTQAASYLLQRQIDWTHREETKISSRRSLATNNFYNAAFGKLEKSEVDFPQAAQEQGISLEEAEARFDAIVRSQNLFKERKSLDKEENCECK